jgi:hypothetical protein
VSYTPNVLIPTQRNNKKTMQSVGIEPTLLRTCALSMRLNHSAKTARRKAPLTQSAEYWSYEPKVAGSNPAWSKTFAFFILHQMVPNGAIGSAPGC